jgi:hypothetical protein
MSRNLSTSELQALGEAVVGAVQWYAPGHGYCECPGKDLHNNPDGRRDCRISVVPGVVAGGKTVEAPTITCFHTGCRSVVADANHRMRSAIGKAKMRAGGGAPPGQRSQGAPPTTQGQASRTPRMPLFNINPAREHSLPNTRTLRTGFPTSCTYKEKIEGSTLSKDVASEPSEMSEAPKTDQGRPDPSEVSEAAQGPAPHWTERLELRRTSEALPPGTTWINGRGSVFQARRTDEAIEIGQQILRGSDSVGEGKA